MGRFLGEREDQVRVLLRRVEGCGSNGQKNSVNRRLFTFYTSNSRCGKCWRQKLPNLAFAGSCTLSEYFPSSYTWNGSEMDITDVQSHRDQGLQTALLGYSARRRPEPLVVLISGKDWRRTGADGSRRRYIGGRFLAPVNSLQTSLCHLDKCMQHQMLQQRLFAANMSKIAAYTRTLLLGTHQTPQWRRSVENIGGGVSESMDWDGGGCGRGWPLSPGIREYHP